MILRCPFIFQRTARDREVDQSQKIMGQIAKGLLNQSKASILGTTDNKGDLGTGRDLLTLLVKSNMSTDVSDKQRLSDQDVIARAFFKLRT